MIRYLAVFLIICATFIPGSALAGINEPIGTIIEVEGSALATRNGVTGAASVDGPVYMGDAVETFAGAKVLILFEDETELTIGENSRLVIDEYIYDPAAPERNKADYSILRGVFLYASGLIAKNDPSDINLETPHGSIGIRGTTVWGGPDGGEYGIFVQEGEVTVTNDRARIRVGSGQGVSLRGRKAMPGEVKQWNADKIARATRTIALKRQAAVRERVQAVRQQHRARIKKRHELQKLAPEQKQEIIKERKERIRENMQDKKESGLPPKKKQIRQPLQKKKEQRRQYKD